MKVLVVTHVNDLSGANKSLLGILNNLKNKANFVVLVNKKNGELTNKLKSMNIRTIYYPYRWWVAPSRSTKLKKFGRQILDGASYHFHDYITKRFLQNIKKEDFDFIYTNTSTVNIGVKLAKKLKIPHIWHIREFGKKDFGFQNIQSKEKYNKTFNQTTSVIAISQAIKKQYKKIISPDKITVIYNGFDIKKLLIHIRKHELNPIKIIITGQVTPAKCTDHAIKACKMLVDQGMSLELHVAGTIDNDYLKSKVPNIDSYDWCYLHGQVNNINKLREQMDLELICSRNEAFGRVTIEAMLAGIPIIGANTGGTKELIKERETGLLYEFGNIKELSEKIKLLYNNQLLYNNLIINAQCFAQQFTISKTSSLVFQEFERVLERKDCL